ncbi:hypothetical protein ABZ567_28375 [Streptomyces sp. NPDC016459]|uniref:hypothetical protein n=1 Tax=Streptomyces sp. NPDC016459 TaxID=3157190 RepID=UPI0033C18D35
MTSPRLLYALNTLIGPWMTLPVAVLEAMNFLQRGMPWRGETLWTVDWFAIALFIIGPLLAGAAAVDASRLSRAGNIHLVLATRRPYRPYLRAAAWCAGPVLVVHLLTIAAALIIGGVPGNPPWPALTAAVAVQCLAVYWYVAIGSAIGRLAGPLMAGATAAVFTFTLMHLLGSGSSGRFEPLALGGATVSRLGYQYAPGYLMAQTVFFTLTGAALLLLPIRLRSGRRTLTAAATLTLVLLAATVIAAQHTLPARRLVTDAAPPTDCTTTAPAVCLYPEHARFRGQINRHVATLTAAARSHGYAALIPERVEELSRTHCVRSPHVSGLQISADAYATDEVSLEEVASALTRPLHCPDFYTDTGPGPAYWQREFSLYATLLHTAGVRVDPHEFPAAPRILTPTEVQGIKNDYAACRLVEKPA